MANNDAASSLEGGSGDATDVVMAPGGSPASGAQGSTTGTQPSPTTTDPVLGATNRVPVYEIHIQPMFRLLDVVHMAPVGVPLGDLASVWANRNAIFVNVSNGSMPPGVGGPWPNEWVQLFQRWMATGNDNQVGHHLVLGTPTGQYSLAQVFGAYTLSATVTPPSPGYQVWFNLDAVTTTQRFYSLVMEPPFPAQSGAGSQVLVKESPFKKGTLTSIVITDSNGTQTLPLS